LSEKKTIGARLAAAAKIPARIEHLARRLEETVAYFAQRSNPLHYTQPVYIGDHTVLALLHGRLMMYLDTRGNDLAPHVMMFGHWEPSYTRLFLRLIRPGDTVLDIGAHLGVYAVLAAAATGAGGKVHAFEPNSRFASLLGRSLAVNGFAGHASVHNLAVGAEEGMTELRFSWAFAGGGHLATGAPRHDSLEGEPCRVVALDEMFADPSFRADVIKMDVEGTETQAVQGMTQLLARSPRVRVMFEFAPQLLAAHGSGAAALIGLFDRLGFAFWNIEADSSLTPVPAADLAARRDGLVNILASRGDPFAA
jgi:FkbM family methyltransferase